MTELALHGKPVHTVFDLLGDKEDDITYSQGWSMAQCEALVAAVLTEFFEFDPGTPETIELQHSFPSAGRTDIELKTEHVYLILEAKRGYDLPRAGQLEQYATRFAGHP